MGSMMPGKLHWGIRGPWLGDVVSAACWKCGIAPVSQGLAGADAINPLLQWAPNAPTQ